MAAILHEQTQVEVAESLASRELDLVHDRHDARAEARVRGIKEGVDGGQRLLGAVDDGHGHERVVEEVLHLEGIDAGVHEEGVVARGVDEVAGPHEIALLLVEVVQGDFFIGQGGRRDLHAKESLSSPERPALRGGGLKAPHVDTNRLTGLTGLTPRVVEQDALAAVSRVELSVELVGAQGANGEPHGEPGDHLIEVWTRARLVVDEELRGVRVEQLQSAIVRAHSTTVARTGERILRKAGAWVTRA